MTKKQKKVLWRIIATAVLVAVVKLFSIGGVAGTVLYLAAYLIIGYDILRKAFRGIIKGQVFDENFLMAVATVGAIALAVYEKSGDYLEAVAVMLFYQIGELFQSYAVGKSRRSITALMDIRPDYANIEQDGKLVQVDPDDVAVGSIIVVQPGEKIPLDGVVTEGSSTLNTAALTGESLPRDAAVGDEVISGCVNMTGVLKIRTTKAFGHGPQRRLGHLGLPCPDLPGHQLPLCAGHQHPPELLRRIGRCQPGRRAGEGLQLSGDPLQNPCGSL